MLHKGTVLKRCEQGVRKPQGMVQCPRLATEREVTDYLNPESSVEKAAGAMAGLQPAHRDPGINTQTSLYPFWAHPTGIRGQGSPLKLFIPASRTTEWDGESEE